MSEKKDKKIRRIARAFYESEMKLWQEEKPAKWRIFKYLKWKKQKPVYEYTEKQVKIAFARREGGR